MLILTFFEISKKSYFLKLAHSNRILTEEWITQFSKKWQIRIWIIFSKFSLFLKKSFIKKSCPTSHPSHPVPYPPPSRSTKITAPHFFKKNHIFKIHACPFFPPSIPHPLLPITGPTHRGKDLKNINHNS